MVFIECVKWHILIYAVIDRVTYVNYIALAITPFWGWIIRSKILAMRTLRTNESPLAPRAFSSGFLFASPTPEKGSRGQYKPVVFHWSWIFPALVRVLPNVGKRSSTAPPVCCGAPWGSCGPSSACNFAFPAGSPKFPPDPWFPPCSNITCLPMDTAVTRSVFEI